MYIVNKVTHPEVVSRFNNCNLMIHILCLKRYTYSKEGTNRLVKSVDCADETFVQGIVRTYVCDD